MRTRLWTLLALAGFAGLAAPGSAAAFGPQGHRVIGAVADKLLTPHAAAQVKLNLGLPLRSAATWADCVRDVARRAGGNFIYRPDPKYHAACAAFETPAGKLGMVNYVRRNWSNCSDGSAFRSCHSMYHFADVAIAHDHYDRAYAGTSDHDIVAAVDAAIAVLQGRPAPAPIVITSRKEALLMLAHFVGDLHQPLHVGSVYLDAQGHEVDPGASDTPHDPTLDTRGGNDLEDGATNLHADWDGVARKLDPTHIAPAMLADARAVAPSPGNVDTWPALWAGETVLAARQAYAGLSFTRAHAAKPGDWVVTFTDHKAYLTAKEAMQAHQLALAGARLAQVLNAIWP